jgi:hypothetical protein
MTTEITFEWKKGGGHVLLAGSFTDWKAVPMALKGGVWKDTIALNPGQYHYKFIVDGFWKYDSDVTLVDDGSGNVNNLLIVGPGSGSAKGPVGNTAKAVVSQPSQNQGNKQVTKGDQSKQQGKKEEGKVAQIKNEKQQQAPQKTQGQEKAEQKPKGTDNKQAAKGDQSKQQGKKEEGKAAQQGKKDQQPGKDQSKTKPEKKKEDDPAKLVGHWEKIQVNTITGKESWWVFVKTDDDPAKYPLRRRIPPDCVSCGNKVLVEDDLFSRYGVEWQPLCLKCYSAGKDVPLVNGKAKLHSLPVCYWCLETEEVTGDCCQACHDYISRLQTNFGYSNNDALTYLYYFQSGLRDSRRKQQ